MKYETKRFIARQIYYFLLTILMLINLFLWSDILNCDDRPHQNIDKIEIVQLRGSESF